jgi:hypothetical protein
VKLVHLVGFIIKKFVTMQHGHRNGKFPQEYCAYQIAIYFLISNFRHVLNVACFLLGNSATSEFYMPKFRNTLSVQSSWAGRYEDGTDRVFRNVGIYNSDVAELPR